MNVVFICQRIGTPVGILKKKLCIVRKGPHEEEQFFAAAIIDILCITPDTRFN